MVPRVIGFAGIPRTAKGVSTMLLRRIRRAVLATAVSANGYVPPGAFARAGCPIGNYACVFGMRQASFQPAAYAFRTYTDNRSNCPDGRVTQVGFNFFCTNFGVPAFVPGTAPMFAPYRAAVPYRPGPVSYRFR
jgi:hypothetical protein